MKKILVVTYYWPPAGGPGIQRILKFVKYLREFGWEPVILTVKNGDYPVKDPNLESEIPEGIKVYKMFIPEPYALYKKFMGIDSKAGFDQGTVFAEKKKSSKQKIVDFIRSNLFIPDAKSFWIPAGITKGLKIAKAENCSAIISTSPPYSAGVIAAGISFFSKIPWIFDCRDPWGSYQNLGTRINLADKFDQFLKNFCTLVCKKQTLAWRGIKKSFPHSHDKTLWIPNGFDFEMPEGYVKDNSDKFELVYAGSFYTRRYPAKFVEILKEIIKENKLIRENLSLRFIGRIDEQSKENFRKHLPEDMVSFTSYLPHNVLIEKLKEASALWIVMDDLAEAKDIVAGKTYEYLGYLKPILACLPRGSETEKIITEAGSGVRIPIENKLAVEKLFTDWITAWISGKSPVTFNTNRIAEYHRRTLTKKLVRILEEAINEN
jgi:glycosyltransferase involved in cell wall biosynthesis